VKKTKVNKHPADVVNLWERLELKLDKDGKVANFITRIEDIDKDMLTVESPIRIAGDLELTVGQHLEAVSNKRDASYVFEAVVTDINPQKENMTTLKTVSEIRRSQRRRFVRIDIAGNITYRVIDKTTQNRGRLSLDKKGELLNISAGGILIITDEIVKQGDFLLMNFLMKDSQRLENILGIAKRIESSVESDNHDNEYLVGIEFLSKEKSSESIPWNLIEVLPPDTNYFSEALQQLIVQYVYKQQVELRKKQKANL
jgi:c-di-GMP-binding flagellar brake protein YcgR